MEVEPLQYRRMRVDFFLSCGYSGGVSEFCYSDIVLVNLCDMVKFVKIK